jgi:hypothetical protein
MELSVELSWKLFSSILLIVSMLSVAFDAAGAKLP